MMCFHLLVNDAWDDVVSCFQESKMSATHILPPVDAFFDTAGDLAKNNKFESHYKVCIKKHTTVY